MKSLFISISFLIISPLASSYEESIFEATLNGNIPRIEYLLSIGTDVNTKNELGWTPFHLALWENRLDAAEFLFSKGADPNIRDENGRTALHFIAETGDKKRGAFLLEKGVNINAQDAYGNTALHIGATYDQRAFMDFLIEQGADLHLRNKSGEMYYNLKTSGHLQKNMDSIKLIAIKIGSLDLLIPLKGIAIGMTVGNICFKLFTD